MTESSRRWALLVVACVIFLNVIDVTILNVAIPTIQRELGTGDAAIQWLVAGYGSMFGILLMTGGRLGDIFGYRRVLNVGLVLFVLTSAACGLATGPSMLIVARLAQGASAALMAPQVQSTIQLMYPPRERVAVLGVIGILGGTAAVAGPLIGGLLIEANVFGLGWRMIFLVNLPLGLLLIVATMHFLPRRSSPLSPKLDVRGTILVTLTFISILVPIVEGRDLGWPIWCLGLLAMSPLLLWYTVRYSHRRMAVDGSSVLVPGLFAEPSFSRGVLLGACFQATMAGTLFVMTLALQNGLAFSAGEVGLIHAPFAIGVAAGVGVLARKILPRVGPIVIVLGAVVMGAGLSAIAWQVRTGVDELASYLVTMGIMGLGCGMMLGSITPITLSEVDTDYAGAASGTLRSLLEFGGASGVAVIGGVFLGLGTSGAPETWMTAIVWSTALTLAVLLVIGFVALSIPRDLEVFAKE